MKKTLDEMTDTEGFERLFELIVGRPAPRPEIVEAVDEINEATSADEVYEACLRFLVRDEDVGHPDFHEDPYFELHTNAGPF